MATAAGSGLHAAGPTNSSLIPGVSIVPAVARSRLAIASPASVRTRSSRLRAAIRSVCRCNTRNTVDVPA
jgi:hypothetical protein